MSRREVLERSAAAGIVGLGAVSALGSASADTGDKLETLRAAGVVHSQSEVLAETGTAVPEDVLSGQRLLDRLAADGLLREASLDALPDFGSDGTDGQVHDVGGSGNRQIAFTTSTPRGRLQVSFREHSAPAAYLRSTDAGPVVMYKPTGGSGYVRFESDLETTGSGGVGTYACTDDNCDGCPCESDWCFWDTVTNNCHSCDDGECIVTDSCGC